MAAEQGKAEGLKAVVRSNGGQERCNVGSVLNTGRRRTGIGWLCDARPVRGRWSEARRQEKSLRVERF
ncbi:hypothetical protein V6N13_020135 [Hibiscus sabdariffa]